MLPSQGDGACAISGAVTILSVPAVEPIAVCLAGRITGLLTHVVHNRSVACPGEEKCPSGLHRGRTVWKGYAPCRLWDNRLTRWAPAVLEVTECLEEQLRGRELAGEVWMLSREGGRKRCGKVVGAYLERKTDAALLSTFDVRPPLFRMYHTTELLLGVANPLPPKLMLPAVELPGPTLPEARAAAPDPAPTPEQLDRLRTFARRARPPMTNGEKRG